MDGNRFDDLARVLGEHGTRRGTLRALSGGLLAALGAGADTSARRKTGRDDRGRLEGNSGKDGKDGRRPAAAARPRPCAERCRGRCVTPCPDVKLRNSRTCQCECPEGMRDCGTTCVGADRCCPGEEECGGGCIREEECCTHTHKLCPDGSCLARGVGACCPGAEVACPNADDGCCNSFAGEECADNGCCNTLISGNEICGGKCVDTRTDEKHCGGCGQECDACSSCRDGRCSSNCGDGRVCCGGSCCHADQCHEGTYCCVIAGDIFCPGTPGTCCRSGYHCKVDSGTGKAYCSSNP